MDKHYSVIKFNLIIQVLNCIFNVHILWINNECEKRMNVEGASRPRTAERQSKDGDNNKRSNFWQRNKKKINECINKIS